MIYSLVFTNKELEIVIETIDNAYVARSKSERNQVIRIIKDKLKYAQKDKGSDAVATMNGDAIERKGRVVPWKKIYTWLEEKLGLGVLAIRLCVPEYICKGIASDLLTPNAKLQESLLNLYVIVRKTTVERALNEII